MQCIWTQVWPEHRKIANGHYMTLVHIEGHFPHVTPINKVCWVLLQKKVILRWSDWMVRINKVKIILHACRYWRVKGNSALHNTISELFLLILVKDIRMSGVGGKHVTRKMCPGNGTHFPTKFCPTGQDILFALGPGVFPVKYITV